MSSEKSVYVGVYLKVFMPKVEVISGSMCPKCKKKTSYNYCAIDGSKTIQVKEEKMLDFNDLCKFVFGNEDQFFTGNIYNKDFVIVMANSSNQPGHLYIEDELEYEIPKNIFSGDFIILENSLKLQNIKYEKCFGIVNFWM